MRANLAELVHRIRPRAGSPLILCEGRTHVDTVPVWVFRENVGNRLQRLGSGVLDRSELDELADALGRENSVWPGSIDTRHDPPSRRFRLVWTRPPAPCRIYTRRGLVARVESAGVTRHLFWRRERFLVQSPSVVEGWISRDWKWAGISLEASGGDEREVLRLKNEGRFTQFLLMYDGIDLMMDTGWLDGLVPRVAEVFGVGWRIVDYTVEPPQIVRQGGPATAPVTSNG